LLYQGWRRTLRNVLVQAVKRLTRQADRDCAGAQRDNVKIDDTRLRCLLAVVSPAKRAKSTKPAPALLPLKVVLNTRRLVLKKTASL
jgi:hypothetical protein